MPHLLIATLLALVCGLASASEGLQGYQEALISDALTFQMLTPDPKPEGKVIERIVIVSYDVVTEHDPWPKAVNWIHATTDRDVIERELLFKAGDRWRPEIIEESARNLRQYLVLSVAEITPTRGSSPDKVIALVTTKDLWSLRLNWSFSYVGSKLEEIDAELAETNLLGRNKSAGVSLRYDLATTSLGQTYRDPRVLGTRLALNEEIRVIGNRSNGNFEGGEASLEVGRPLFSLGTEWAWTVSASYLRDVYRLFSAGELAEVRVRTGETVPYSFHRETLNLRAGVTRSFGRRIKRNVSVGWMAYTRSFELPRPPLKNLQAASISQFRDEQLPFDQRVGALFASYHLFRTDYVKLRNFDTFALTEDLLLGPNVTLGMTFASPAFGFDSAFVEPHLDSSYSWAFRDNVLVAGVDASLRYQPGSPFESSWVDQELKIGIKHYSARFAGLRLVTAARGARRIHDLDRSFSVLGGDNLLRGFPSSYFTGPSSWSANTELRTLPWVFQTVHTGAAAFVDLGDAFRDGDPIGIHASTGLGLRFLFPQFNRAVLRADLGFPLETGAGIDPMSFTAQFGQAF